MLASAATRSGCYPMLRPPALDLEESSRKASHGRARQVRLWTSTRAAHQSHAVWTGLRPAEAGGCPPAAFVRWSRIVRRSASAWSQVFDSAGQGLARMRDGPSTESRPPCPLGFAAALRRVQVRTRAEAGHARQSRIGERDEAVRPGAQLPCPYVRSAQASRRTCADAARHIEMLRARSDATLPELEALRRDHVAAKADRALTAWG